MTVQQRDRRYEMRGVLTYDGGPTLPPDTPDFDHGGRGNFPSWSTHLMAFLFGGITFCTLIFTPMFVPVIALVGIVGIVGIAVRRRWR